VRRLGLSSTLTLGALALVALAVFATSEISFRQARELVRRHAVERVDDAARRVAAFRAVGHPALSEPQSLPAGVTIEVVPIERLRAATGGEVAAVRAAGEGPIALWIERGGPGVEGAFAAVPISESAASSDSGMSDAAPASFVLARIARADAEATLRRFVWGAWAAGLSIAAAATLAAAAFGRRLARPVKSLSREARRIGEGDLDRPIAPSPKATAEVAGLSASLERMRQRLSSTTTELTRGRGELAAVLSGVAEGVLAVDDGRVIRFANRPAERLVRSSAAVADVVGKFCGDVLYAGVPAAERPCEHSCPILHARFRGRTRALERVAEQPVVVSSSEPVGGLQVLILRPETGAEAVQRARDEAVGELAHELQTPLAAQLAALELLRDRVGSTDDASLDLVLSLEAGTFRLRRLVDNLLESVRIESGQMSLRRVDVEIDDVVEDAVSMTRPLLSRRGQALELEVPYPAPRLVGDPPRLTQVLVNLIANASKYGPEDSAVRLEVRSGAAGIEFVVEDRGSGFPESIGAPGRFRRGDRVQEGWSEGSEPRQEGSGLGLWICRSILERHGGGLRIERRVGIDGEARTRVVAVVPSVPTPNAADGGR
jgi:signal transduction histidine kinase/HAMP domain-containing protein